MSGAPGIHCVFIRVGEQWSPERLLGAVQHPSQRALDCTAVRNGLHKVDPKTACFWPRRRWPEACDVAQP